MTGTLAPLMALAGLFGAAWLLTAVMLGGGRNRNPFQVIEALAWAPGVGAGLLSLLVFFNTCLGRGAPSPREALLLFGLLLLALLLLHRQKLSQDVARLPASIHKSSLPKLAGTSFLLVSLAGIFVLRVTRQPDGQWDGMAVWNMLARTLHRAPTDPSLALGRLHMGHPEYPQLLPGAIAGLWDLSGTESPLVPQGLALGFLLASGGLIWSLLRRLSQPAAAWAGLLLLLTTPYLVERAAGQYADVPLSYLLLGSAGGLSTLLHPDPRRRLPPLLVGLFLGFLPWMKNEGLLWALVLLLTFVLFLVHKGRGARGWRLFLPLLGGAGAPLLALLLFRLAWSPPDPLLTLVPGTLLHHVQDPERFGRAARGIWRELSRPLLPLFAEPLGPSTSPPRWGGIWLGLLLLILPGLLLLPGRVVRRLRQGPSAFLILVMLLLSITLFMLYVLIPFKQAWYLKTSLSRLLLQLLPTLLLTLLVLVPIDALESEPRPSPASKGKKP